MTDNEKAVDIIFYALDSMAGVERPLLMGFVKEAKLRDYRNMCCTLMYNNGMSVPELSKIFKVKKGVVADSLRYHDKSYEYVSTFVRQGKRKINWYKTEYDKLKVLVGDVTLELNEKVKKNGNK